MGSFIQRRVVAAGRAQASPVDDPYLRERFPALLEFLAMSKWDDGAARRTGTLTLFVEAGAFKACLNDRDGAMVAFVTGEGMEAVLDAANAMLASGDGDWRAAAGSRKK